MRKILFIAATHGNEPIGVDVLRLIEKDFPKAVYGYDWIIGNELAYERGVRYVETDLNRSAPGDLTSEIYEVRRAAEICEIAKRYDMVIDIHGTVTDCGVVTIIPYPTSANIDLAEATGIERNVIWHSDSSKVSGPLAQHVGIAAIELECGPKNNSGVADALKDDLKRILKRNLSDGLSNVAEGADFYNVYGKLAGTNDPHMKDFVETVVNGEKFYPFLSGNEYASITCYKMKKIKRNQIVIM